MNAMRLFQLIALLLALVLPGPALAQVDDATFAPLVDALAPGNFKDRETAAAALAGTEDPRAVLVLQTLLDGELYVVKDTGKVLLGTGTKATDPVTGEAAAETGKAEKVKVNNGLRRALRTLIGQLTLMSDDRGTRLSAARSVLRDYGNMSAPTVLFVLERTLRAGARGRHLMAALGPGFTASFAILEL